MEFTILRFAKVRKPKRMRLPDGRMLYECHGTTYRIFNILGLKIRWAIDRVGESA